MATSQPPTNDGPFNIVQTYQTLLHEDPDLTMPVAAIESLILGLSHTPSTTVSETLDLVSKLTLQLKRSIPNSISLSAGTDIFQQYLIANLQKPGPGGLSGDFENIRSHLVQNGRLFVERAKAARETIASFGRQFIRDGNTILTNGGSRVVGALLRSAAEEGNASGKGSIRFRVIYVVSTDDKDTESAENIAALRERDIPVATIPPTAIAYCLDQVTQCFVGAEGVVENGGIISRMGTYQMGMLAKAAGKPFYVVSESHKFVRLYPLGQQDLGIQQNVVDFQTAKGSEDADEGVADMDVETKVLANWRPEDAVDYTPPNLISGIITESGVLLPSAVSERLIEIWF
ncbi:hypothetical protein PRZ48_014381 [Zasmidium cellare]|uniref:Translation initiation factor eIF2B subunit alpha n=1 Tax=Zasmidium cellare TaxID=395010 RepID=A0ABR0DYU1_ZASCE|nr:hypothetical protein PRZ48_014381 [Zasmidium cellare]